HRADPVHPADRHQGRRRRARHRRGDAHQDEQPSGRHKRPRRRRPAEDGALNDVTGALANGPRGVRLLVGLTLCAAVIVSLLTASGGEGLFGAYLAVLMLAIAATDAQRYLIPNELTAAAFALALLRSGALAPDAGAGAGAALWAGMRATTVALPLLLLML